jgi:hypothetical protein
MEEKSNKRTTPQNRAYQKWIQETADECVAKGINLFVLYDKPEEIPVTKESLHKGMTHKLIKVRYDKNSTADLTTKEMTETIEDLRRIISMRSKGKVNLPFPSQLIKQLEDEQFNENIKNF